MKGVYHVDLFVNSAPPYTSYQPVEYLILYYYNNNYMSDNISITYF